jgi:tungstate transport system ATP-binding protein
MTFIAELRNVTQRYNEITALTDVSLQIREGEVLGLLGSNGSGKTTLLKILAFLLKPTRGKVHFDGRLIKAGNMEKMRFMSTMVFQKTMLFNTTVYNNIAYGLRMRKMSTKEINEKVSENLKLVKLEGFERRQAKKLSGGEQQRVALATALALNTRLLLLDEPTANLDPRNVSIIEEAMSLANREFKTTIVMATHNMLQARNLPTRIALIKEGRIDDVGTASEIFSNLSKTLTSFAALENTFTGTARPAELGPTSIDIGDGVNLETTARCSGTVSIFVKPEDIIVSKTHFVSSARNVLKGEVAEILDSGSLVRLKVNAGKTLTVQITKRSFVEMQLRIGDQVFLAFKASSVQTV